MVGSSGSREHTGSFQILAHEELNKINDFHSPSGPTIAIDFETRKCTWSSDGNFEKCWARLSNATNCKKSSD
ncbi:hypothetical protein X748_08960 [Mesorhizobium sp. LNJC386A00]|nr:hypothetical protein X766_08395 [Mesorhizobium sp. LSJC255A00]ESX29151.1 hypothetical protein X764_32100 [Mesorhizobium sp. LSHC440A00]ESY12477.1 hypothetical protein X752_09960 [Mesorhizobium sp. LNJC398B00]ESY37742.1 hypothetical protein X748_08960 [Mesorhizobium sp. LNJC386A00]